MFHVKRRSAKWVHALNGAQPGNRPCASRHAAVIQHPHLTLWTLGWPTSVR